MSTPVRDWPNTYIGLRDNMSELMRKEIADLEQITKNKVNGEEEMEAIAAGVISELNVCLRALERAGAATDPISELDNKVREIKSHPVLVSA